MWLPMCSLNDVCPQLPSGMSFGITYSNKWKESTDSFTHWLNLSKCTSKRQRNLMWSNSTQYLMSTHDLDQTSYLAVISKWSTANKKEISLQDIHNKLYKVINWYDYSLLCAKQIGNDGCDQFLQAYRWSQY